MNKIFKRTLLVIAAIVSAVFINGCYYVFFGQEKSIRKLQAGKELNLYECCSIYSMHTAVWMFGWVISPEAAKECFLLHFPQKDTVEFKPGKILNTPKIKAAINNTFNQKVGTSTRITWDGDKDYALGSPEHRTAIALNPCTVTKLENNFGPSPYMSHVKVTSPMIYPEYSRTQFNLGKFSIYLHEGLFRYLQDKGWLSKYVAEYDFYEVKHAPIPEGWR